MIELALAARMNQAAVVRAAELGAAISAAVVDEGGHLVHFVRMDGAEIAGPTLAVDKAYTAVAHRTSTAELGPLTVPGGVLQGMHANGSGRYVVFPGGLPCRSTDTQPSVVGGIGVSGGSAEEDTSCAQAALDVFAGEVAL
ncbi:MAG: GlcG/HbpS family heme-binding protein [Nocardioides sp.]